MVKRGAAQVVFLIMICSPVSLWAANSNFTGIALLKPTSKWQSEADAFLLNLKRSQSPPFFKTFKTPGDIVDLPPQAQQDAVTILDSYNTFSTSLHFPQLSQKVHSEYQTISAINEIKPIVTKVKAFDITGALDEINSLSHEGISADDQFVWVALAAMKKPLELAISESQLHKTKGQVFEAAGKTSEAIDEYKQSYNLVHDDALLSKIKKLHEQSHGS